MKALYAGAGRVHFRDVPVPALGHPLAALARPLAVALCDLDHAYLRRLVPTSTPFAFGHEFTAEILEVGAGVCTVKPGDRVVVPFQISCGVCSACRGGRSLDCASVPAQSAYGLEPFWGGSEWGGAAAEVVRIPYADAMCWKLAPDADAVALASVSDNIPDGYRCIAPYAAPGVEAIIFGSSSVGLYAVATAAALGVPCTYVDRHQTRLALAERLGAKVIEGVPNGEPFGEFALSVAAISTAQGLLSALRSTAPSGICHSAGIQFQAVSLPLLDLYRRGIRFNTGRVSAREHIPSVLKLIELGRLRVQEIVGNVIAFEDAPALLERSLTHKTVVRMT